MIWINLHFTLSSTSNVGTWHFKVQFTSYVIKRLHKVSNDKIRAHGAVFKVQAAGDHLFWSRGEWQIWLFFLCGCLELSDYWTFLGSLLSGVMFINFKQLKSTFLLLSQIAHAGQDLPIEVCRSGIMILGSCNAFTFSVCHRNASETTSSAGIIRFKNP